VPLIAAAAARYWQQHDWLNSPYRKYMPWALADAARVSLASATEHNRSDATDQDLLQVLNAFSRFDDPFLRDSDVHGFLLRMAGQQMTWQVPEYEKRAGVGVDDPAAERSQHSRDGLPEVAHADYADYAD
jgi:hypothetical protein